MNALLKGLFRRMRKRTRTEVGDGDQAGRVTLRTWNEWRRGKESARSEGTNLFAELDANSQSFEDWLTAQAEEPRTFVGLAKTNLANRIDTFADSKTRCLATADRLLKHEFNLLGSGVFVPICPERPTVDSYTPIDWVLDPVKGLRFPQDFHYKDWDLMRDRPGSADVKFPWEMARCQHFLTLAQAWCLTRDQRYAEEILMQIRDFDTFNKVARGVNWTCTMDVGIRAANWAIALDLIKTCDGLDEDALGSGYACLFEHGQFIRENLENHYEVTSNHYLSNIVGLHFVGSVFKDTDFGTAWIEFALESVPREVDIQVLPDGADFESAIPYHRLVLELFLASLRQAQHLGDDYSEHYKERLVQMTDYLADTLRPDGRMPVLGDCDDGRFIIATDMLTWDRQDPRHIFFPAALTLDQDRWLQVCTPSSLWEAFWWGFDVAGLNSVPMRLKDHSTLFPDAGIGVSRWQDQYLMVTNPIVGTVGFGNHKHNEQLGFEYHDRGVPLFVDTGSYVYTGDAEGRNLFRSTAHHNTVQVDGVEQNDFNPEWLFRMFEKANPEHIEFTNTEGVTTYVGMHHGYEEQLEEGVTHRRTFEHDRNTGSLSIEDMLTGSGIHDLAWHFHLDPNVGCGVSKNSDQIKLNVGRQQWVFDWEGCFDEVQILDSWVSPSYGVRIPSRQICCKRTGVPLSSETWRFRISRVTPTAAGSR